MSTMTLAQLRNKIALSSYPEKYEWIDAIDAELKARGEPVAIVGPDDVIWLKDEACEVDVLLYTAPPAPKIEVTDAMVERAQDTLENTTRSIGHHHMRRLLEAALKEAP